MTGKGEKNTDRHNNIIQFSEILLYNVKYMPRFKQKKSRAAQTKNSSKLQFSVGDITNGQDSNSQNRHYTDDTIAWHNLLSNTPVAPDLGGPC